MITFFSEFIGTFALLSSILFSGNALLVGLTLATVIWAIGDISGAHVNPIVTFVMYLKGNVSFKTYNYYFIAQALGGLAAYYTYKFLES